MLKDTPSMWAVPFGDSSDISTSKLLLTLSCLPLCLVDKFIYSACRVIYLLRLLPPSFTSIRAWPCWLSNMNWRPVALQESDRPLVPGLDCCGTQLSGMRASIDSCPLQWEDSHCCLMSCMKMSLCSTVPCVMNKYNEKILKNDEEFQGGSHRTSTPKYGVLPDCIFTYLWSPALSWHRDMWPSALLSNFISLSAGEHKNPGFQDGSIDTRKSHG